MGGRPMSGAGKPVAHPAGGQLPLPVQLSDEAVFENFHLPEGGEHNGNRIALAAVQALARSGACGVNGLALIKATTGGHTATDAQTTVITSAELDVGGAGLKNNGATFALI